MMSSNVIPLFGKTTTLLLEGRRARLEAEVRHPQPLQQPETQSNVTPIFDPETQRIVTLRAILAEMDSWVPLGAHRSATTGPR
jgi:hypothetical protein